MEHYNHKLVVGALTMHAGLQSVYQCTVKHLTYAFRENAAHPIKQKSLSDMSEIALKEGLYLSICVNLPSHTIRTQPFYIHSCSETGVLPVSFIPTILSSSLHELLTNLSSLLSSVMQGHTSDSKATKTAEL